MLFRSQTYSENHKKSDCVTLLKRILLSKEFIKDVLKVLHKIITQELNKVGIMVQCILIEPENRRSNLSFSFDTLRVRSAKILSTLKILEGYESDSISIESLIWNNIDIKELIEKEYKYVLKECIFKMTTKKERKIYEIVCNEYNKLMKRYYPYTEIGRASCRERVYVLV